MTLAAAAAKSASGMSLGILGALLLAVVAFRVWRSGMTCLDAVLAILLGVVIASAGDGFLGKSADWVINAIRAVFGFLANLFN